MSNLSCGIIGLPNVGKSTIFNAICKKKVEAQNYPFCTIEPNIAVVPIYDERLEKLSILSKSKKTIPATVTFVDIAGLVKGAAKGEGLGNKFLRNIKETDAILHVVRCFESDKITHVEGKIDPIDDIETINLELMLADLEQAQNSLKKLEKKSKGKKEAEKELIFLKKVVSHLSDNRPLRTLDIESDEKEFFSTHNFLTRKKVLYVANVSEGGEKNLYFQKVLEYAKKENHEAIAISAKLEEEIGELEEQDAKSFLESIGEQSGLEKVIKKSFKLLGLITYITTGEKETKAWVIKKGTKAPKAASKIHTDIEKGFIKAEVISYNDMIRYNGRVGAREHGLARIEGRDYVVKDGDVILYFHKN